MKNIFKIKLDIPNTGEFINAANSIPNDVNLFQGKSVVSGKSLLGIYSLDLSQDIDLVVRDRDDDKIVYEKFGKWIIE